MIIVHHLENSRSQRILWLLEELGVPYEVKRYERNKKTMLAPDSLRAVHPLGLSPVITDEGIVVAESGAIIEYLVERYGAQGNTRLVAPPAGTEEKRRYTYWLHAAEGSLMPLILLRLVFSKIRSAPLPFFLRPVARGIAGKADAAFSKPELIKQLAFIEKELDRSPWFAGAELTAADVQMSYPLEVSVERQDLSATHPNIVAFVAKVRARAAYIRALERGGPYNLRY